LANLAAACDYWVSSPKVANYKGGTVSLKVAGSEKTCAAPEVIENSDWLGGFQLRWSNGKGKLNLIVSANDTAFDRSAEIFVGGISSTIIQKAAPCKFSPFSPKKGILPASGGIGSFSFSLPAGCSWAAEPDEKSTWLSVDTTFGDGSGEVLYAAPANDSGKVRSGKINVTLPGAGKTSKYSVKQEK
jgi:hypothetical protein